MYDFINQEYVEMFHINCLPRITFVQYMSKLDEMNLFVCVSYDEVFVLEFEPPTNSSVASFVSGFPAKCYALSPDNLYLACCYEDRILTIRSVDSGKSLQTVLLKQTPEACCWSELYLWVVCKVVVLKYPYDSKHNKMLGTYVEECAINFKSVLKFAEGVLVIQVDDSGEIAILKTCDNKLYRHQIPDSTFTATSVSISSDGCAVLLYRESCSDYQLWEIASEDMWEIRSTGRLDDYDRLIWFCLTGTKHCRSSIWLTNFCTSYEDLDKQFFVSSIVFPSCTQAYTSYLNLSGLIYKVIYVNSNILIIHQYGWIYFLRVPECKILTSLYVGLFPGHQDVSSFYIPSQGILVFGYKTNIKFFKIHNIESHIPMVMND